MGKVRKTAFCTLAQTIESKRLEFRRSGVQHSDVFRLALETEGENVDRADVYQNAAIQYVSSDQGANPLSQKQFASGDSQIWNLKENVGWVFLRKPNRIACSTVTPVWSPPRAYTRLVRHKDGKGANEGNLGPAANITITEIVLHDVVAAGAGKILLQGFDAMHRLRIQLEHVIL
jgi:hypothetical protein